MNAPKNEYGLKRMHPKTGQKKQRGSFGTTACRQSTIGVLRGVSRPPAPPDVPCVPSSSRRPYDWVSLGTAKSTVSVHLSTQDEPK